MKIEEMLAPGELILFNSKTHVNDKKRSIFISLLVLVLDALALIYFLGLEEIAVVNRVLMISLMIVMLLFAIYNMIISMIIVSNNNKTEYWITNKQVIVYKSSGITISNDINLLSAVDIIKAKKGIGSLILYFGVEKSFIKHIFASIINTKQTDKVILFTNIDNPLKAVKILKNLNEEAIVTDETNMMALEAEREEEEKEQESNQDA